MCRRTICLPGRSDGGAYSVLGRRTMRKLTLSSLPVHVRTPLRMMDHLKWIYCYLFLVLVTSGLQPGLGSRNHVVADFRRPLMPLEDSGELRLKGLYNGEGIVEIRHRAQWGLICASEWTMAAGDVACRQLGYEGITRVMQMTPGSDDRTNLVVLLNGTDCWGDEERLMDCGHSGFGNFTELCQPLRLPWVSCVGAERPPEEETDNNVPMSSRVLYPELTTIAQDIPAVSAQYVGSDRVTLSWLHWYDHLRASEPAVYRVRIVIKYRRVEGLVHETPRNFTVAAETPTYWTHYTITDLDEQTAYEFLVESVRLSILGGEVTEPPSAPVFVRTVCSGPHPVRRLQVERQVSNSTSLMVSWLVPLNGGCRAEEYVVEYRQVNVEQCQTTHSHPLPYWQSPPTLTLAGVTSSTRYVIGGLQPYSTYDIIVTARNHFGASRRENVTERTAEAVPTDIPVNIVHTYQSQHNLKVTWDPPTCGHRGGHIKTYAYMLIDISTDSVTQRGSTHREFIVLPGVDSLQMYKFLVAASTSSGLGPFAVASIPVEPNILHICGKAREDPVRTARISSGLQASRGTAPWMAQLWSVQHGGMFCAGSILNEEWILTAAHCIEAQSMTTSTLKIQLGDYDTMVPEAFQRAYDVAEIIVHESFLTNRFDHDLALIRLTERIEFNDFIRPICFPPTKLAKALLKNGRYGRVAGWGRVGSGLDREYPRYLKQVMVPIVERKTCRRSTTFQFTANMFCAGYKQANQGDACEGDSGAPFNVQHTNGRWYILGTVSWGEGCDMQDKFGYYTRLHRYTSWIKRHTRVKMTEIV